MKTRLLATISFFVIISISFAQGQGGSNSAARIDPLPGTPEPIYPPGCIPPGVPTITYYVLSGQTLPGLLSWKVISGATGYYIYVSKNGSSTLSLRATISATPIPAGGKYTAIYDNLGTGTYTFYIESFNSGCGSGLSKPFTLTIMGEYVDQPVDPQNNPYPLDLQDFLLDYNSGHGGDRVATPISEASVSGLYPNPVSGTLNVSLSSDDRAGTEFLIHDINGRTVKLPVISSGKNAQIDTSSIPSGIYFLTVTSKNDNFRQKFIKK